MNVWNNPLQVYLLRGSETLSLQGIVVYFGYEVYLCFFYAIVVMVFLMILNIAYVSFSISRSYFTITWPLHLLRTCAKVIVTILFMPMFGNQSQLKII